MEYSNDFLYALEIWGVMPPKISTLPTEIIEQIFEYVSLKDRASSFTRIPLGLVVAQQVLLSKSLTQV
jgi:hypothetical protein